MIIPTVLEKSATGERAYDLYSRLLKDRIRSVPFKWVVTGAHYSASPKVIGKNKVPVPDFLYKVAFFESGNVVVYIVDNLVPKSQVSTMKLEELEAKIGYKLR
jgi:DNA/RNA endonuclease G (NUC1)